MDGMTFVLFGATGDLAKRKIFPALYNLFLDNKLPSELSIIGLGLEPFSESEFLTYVSQSLDTFSRRKQEKGSGTESFLQRIRYLSFDLSDKEGYHKLLSILKSREDELSITENRLFYMSVAPEFFEIIAINIKESGLGSTSGWKRLIIEKPFGHDLKSAQALNHTLSTTFDEDEIFRIDHYLGKPMVQNLEALEFANPVLQALWNNQFIANVQLTASETVGVGERGGYYDHSGSIRDMVQNHLLQMLMMTAMHPPKRISASSIRSEKQKIIESLRPLSPKDVAKSVIRAQYGPGEIEQKAVPGYREEDGIEPFSTTDTFLAARIWIDDSYWEGVPFYIRTGKRMEEKSTRIVIEFKNPLKDLYQNNNEQPSPNLLIIQVSPNEGLELILNSRNSLNGLLAPVTVDFSPRTINVPEAYELLLFDVLRGKSVFFAHWSEVEQAWIWVQPILDAFESNQVPLQFYPSGSMGPEEANQLLAEQGYKWW